MAHRQRALFLATLLTLAAFTLPEANGQEAVKAESDPVELVQALNQRRTELPAVFSHNFVNDGLPPKFFVAGDADLDNMQQRRDGLVLRVQANGTWTSTNLSLQFQLVGDFDVEADFTGLKFKGPEFSGVGIAVAIDDEQKLIPRILRSKEVRERQTVRVSISKIIDGKRDFGDHSQARCEAMSGVLRLSRRGKTIYYLVADKDTADFRLVGQRTATAAPTTSKAIQFRSLSDGSSSSEVVWTDIRVAAERLLQAPPKGVTPIRSLYVLTFADGSLKKIAEPKPGMTQLGSAEWSSDGKTIVCDMSKGSTATSRIIRMKADGSDFEDLGHGCMPSLSPDGKKIVYSVPGRGITTMNSDGSNVETIDAQGWGTQWSPDGKHIAWASGNNITLLNTETDERTQLLTPAQQQMVGHIYWNLGWSHDSKSIAFKSGSPAGQYQLVVADIGAPDGFQVLYTSTNMEEDVSWMADNKSIIFTAKLEDGSRRELATISREKDAVAKRLSAIPEGWIGLNPDCSPDGKYAVFAGAPPPEPTEWTGK